MRATDLLAKAYVMCLDGKNELHQAWISQSFKLAEVAGIAHAPTIQANNRLDILIRQLEEEWKLPPEGVVDLSLDLRFSLSECWVLRAYEVVRAASAQLRFKGDANEKLIALRKRMGAVRIPLAKGEIQGMDKKAAEPIVLMYEDGTGAKEYANDGTYVMPRQVCADSGSAMWCPVDVTTKQPAQIRRIDLSNELLNLFD